MTFAEIEEHRERVAGLEWEQASEPEELEDGYESDDPKSEGYHDRYADVWDLRERE